MKLEYSLKNISKVSQKIVENIKHKIIVFEGEMGSGKTTLIKSICKKINTTDDVSSPTFSLINEYKSQNSIIYHFDFYRIKNINEAYDFGANEYIDSGRLCLIEWGFKIKEMLPEQYHIIKIKKISKNLRELIFLKNEFY
jgi:tRNA threonylcarbamoyladenosine biosynthesis protein TsaE|tara:strand:+ start:2086 stop:2505 length:420 start_codon:yes stop_codon:yes gene_type:complete